MRDHYSLTLRIISTIVLSFFTWTFGGVFDIAYAVKDSNQLSASSQQRINKNNQQADSNNPQTKKETRPEEKFGKDIEEIANILKDDKSDHETKKSKIRSKQADIDAGDVEIKRQFKDTEDRIKNLPEVIKQRHRDFVKKYDDNLQTLKTNLNDIDKAKTDGEKTLAQKKAKDFLDKVKPPKKHQALDPNKLPHRTEEPVFKEPRTKPEEFTEGKKLNAMGNEQKPLLVASNGSLSGLISKKTATTALSEFPDGSYQLALAIPPTSADLAETIEVQFTPGITAKAAELEHNPVKIYNWVRNNVEYVPTYGSIQGANMCLQTKLCNDFDTASLLIALLRASGIHARYVYGTIELPIEKVKNWAGGFTDSMESLRLFASAGVPTKGLVDGGVIKYARVEHVWVESFIDYFPSRGSKHKNGNGSTWIPLDASFKQYAYTAGIDVKTAVPFDAQTFTDQIKSTATINEQEGYVTGISSTLIQQGMQDYQTRLQNYISQNYPNATVGDVLGKKDIVKQEFPYLLGTLPYKATVVGARYSAVPDNFRHWLSFSFIKNMFDSDIGTPINITKSLPELAGKKITLSYSPATASDEAVIISYLPNPHADGTPIQPNELPSSLPAYLINLKPELRIDGLVVATGTSVGMGNKETFTMMFSGPGQNANDVITNDVTAGQYLGIGLDLGRISQGQITALKTKLEATKGKLQAHDYLTIGKDDVLGDLLYITALSYFAELDATDAVTATNAGVYAVRLPSESIFSTELKVNSFFGMPFSVRHGGMAMDVDRAMTLTKALDGDNLGVKQFMLASGVNSSVFEHSVPEQLFSTADNPAYGISAVKALQLANDQGIPIYTINQSNIAVILPQLQLDNGTIADIQNAVNAGKIVSVSKTDIQFHGWNGCGYIVIEPNSGAGAYMISGGLNGTWADAYWVDIAWTIGYYELFWLSKLGEGAIASLTAFAIEPALIALTLIIPTMLALSSKVPYLGECLEKAINANTLGFAIQAILKLPKRFVDGYAGGGEWGALFQVAVQLAKIWGLTCGAGK
ncbi:MAG: transglutaminase-like domain-containing protein [Thermodesulfovibrionales bacterium]